jgi:hypothetical protein
MRFKGALRAEKGRGIKEGEGGAVGSKRGDEGKMGKCWYEVAEVIKVRLIKYYNYQKQRSSGLWQARASLLLMSQLRRYFILFP